VGYTKRRINNCRVSTMRSNGNFLHFLGQTIEEISSIITNIPMTGNATSCAIIIIVNSVGSTLWIALTDKNPGQPVILVPGVGNPGLIGHIASVVVLEGLSAIILRPKPGIAGIAGHLVASTIGVTGCFAVEGHGRSISCVIIGVGPSKLFDIGTILIDLICQAISVVIVVLNIVGPAHILAGNHPGIVIGEVHIAQSRLTLHVLNLVKSTIGIIQVLVKGIVGPINLLQGADGVGGLSVVIVSPNSIVPIGIGEGVQSAKGVVIILGHLTINIAVGDKVTIGAVIDVVLGITLGVGNLEETTSVFIIAYCLYRILSSKIKDKA
jgi:hypothetical protein